MIGVSGQLRKVVWVLCVLCHGVLGLNLVPCREVNPMQIGILAQYISVPAHAVSAAALELPRSIACDSL